MLKNILKICAAGIAALSSACDDGPASIDAAPRSQAIDSTFTHVVTAGPLLLEIIGQPFAMEREVFLNLLAKMLEDAVNHNPPLRYTFDQRAPLILITARLLFSTHLVTLTLMSFAAGEGSLPSPVATNSRLWLFFATGRR
jgi:hypothetical protein